MRSSLYAIPSTKVGCCLLVNWVFGYWCPWSIFPCRRHDFLIHSCRDDGNKQRLQINDTIRRFLSPERMGTWPLTVIFRQNLVCCSSGHCCIDNKTVTLYCRAISDVCAGVIIHTYLTRQFNLCFPISLHLAIESCRLRSKSYDRDKFQYWCLLYRNRCIEVS